jgi:hypothetical protein
MVQACLTPPDGMSRKTIIRKSLETNRSLLPDCKECAYEGRIPQKYCRCSQKSKSEDPRET